MRKSYSIKLVVIAIILFSTICGCTENGFRKNEISLIRSSGLNSTMPVFTINNKSDSLFLRQVARKVRKRDIDSSPMKQLRSRMLSTVKDTLNMGVGIAATQVGIGIQLIYVQRIDKDGEPFEAYFNPKIEIYGDSINSGPEGCLSVPGFRGKVDRSHNITLSYLDSLGKKQKETVNGFTAVIFQHETDHLNGVLFFDHVFGGFNSLTPAAEN
jgi:peptide deformylase